MKITEEGLIIEAVVYHTSETATMSTPFGNMLTTILSVWQLKCMVYCKSYRSVDFSLFVDG